jgi:transposase
LAQEPEPPLILAEDEAKLYLQASTMAAWAPRGRQVSVRVDPSRKSTSFYGTLNLHTGQEVVTEVDKMNAKASAAHLQTVLDTYPTGKIVLLWDKAPWHRGSAIRDLLAHNPRLTLLSFPTASPDLNPQEHVWRATRRKVVHNHSQRRLPDLAARFKHHLTQTTFASSFLDRYCYPVCPGFI